jgi:hypothetical protein
VYETRMKSIVELDEYICNKKNIANTKIVELFMKKFLPKAKYEIYHIIICKEKNEPIKTRIRVYLKILADKKMDLTMDFNYCSSDGFYFYTFELRYYDDRIYFFNINESLNNAYVIIKEQECLYVVSQLNIPNIRITIATYFTKLYDLTYKTTYIDCLPLTYTFLLCNKNKNFPKDLSKIIAHKVLF